MVRFLLSSASLSLALVLGICGGAIGMSEGAIAQVTQQIPELAQKKAEADRLLEQSKQLEQISEYEAALKSATQALAIYKNIGDRNGEAESLNILGTIYRSLSPYDKALGFSQKALDIFRETKNRNGEAESLYNLAWINNFLDDYDQAFSYSQKSLAIFRETKNKQGEAAVLYLLGGYYVKLGDRDKSISYLKQAQSISQSGSFLHAEAQALIGRGHISKDLAKYDEANSFFEQALVISRQVKSRSQEAESLRGLGNVRHETLKYGEAIEYFNQALFISQQIKHPRIESTTLYWLGSSKAELLQFEEAISYLRQAKEISRRIQLPRREASSTGKLGVIYRNSKDFQKAKEAFQEAADIARKSGFYEEEFLGLSSLLSLYREERNSKAFEISERYLELARKISPEKEAEAMLDLASKDFMSDYNLFKATELLQKALQRIQSVDLTKKTNGQQKDIVYIHQRILGALAGVFAESGDYKEAMNIAKEQLSLVQSIQNINLEIDSRIIIAKIHRDKKEWDLALDSLGAARRLIKNMKEFRAKQKSALESSISSHFVEIYVLMGESDKAIAEANKAIEFANDTSDPRLQLNAFESLRKAREEANDFSGVLEAIKNQVIIARNLKNDYDKTLALGQLSQFYLNLGDYKTGRMFLKEAELSAKASKIRNLELLTQVLLAEQDFLEGNPKAVVELEKIVSQHPDSPRLGQVAYFVISKGYGELGNDKRALEAAHKSLAFTRKTGNKWAESSVLLIIGDLHRLFGRYQEAISSYNSALSSLGKRQDIYTNTNAFKIYAGLAKTYAALNQPTVAITFYKQAISGVEKSRTYIRPLSTDLQQSFLQSTVDFSKGKTADIYRNLADLLIQQNRLLEAQQILDLLKLQEIKDYAPPTRNTLQETEVKLTETEQKIAKQHGSLITFRQKLDQCQGKGDTTNCINLSNEHLQLGESLNQFLDTLKNEVDRRCKTDKATDCLRPDDKFTTAANRLITAQPGSLVILPVVLDSKIWILVISEGGLITRYETNIDRITLGKKVLQLRQHLDSPTSDLKTLQATSQQLYDWLIRPIEPQLKAQKKPTKLIFALDRVTRYIPMGVLHDGQQYLTQRYPISTILSIETTNTEKSAIADIPNTPVLALGVSQAIKGYRALPAVNPELASIVQNTGIYPGKVLLDAAFTSSNLFFDLKDYKILHIATHGKFDPTRTQGSFLLLGNGEELLISKIRTLKSSQLDLDLVVLSACQTALGNAEQEGIEIPGISSYFLDKGAKSVIASLWSVDDASTAILMQHLYRHLSQGKSKTEALQQAQLDLLNIKDTNTKDQAILSLPRIKGLETTQLKTNQNPIAPGYTHPYYWAPFILIGNSR
jgi:CHAT domain-containing protein